MTWEDRLRAASESLMGEIDATTSARYIDLLAEYAREQDGEELSFDNPDTAEQAPKCMRLFASFGSGKSAVLVSFYLQALQRQLICEADPDRPACDSRTDGLEKRHWLASAGQLTTSVTEPQPIRRSLRRLLGALRHHLRMRRPSLDGDSGWWLGHRLDNAICREGIADMLVGDLLTVEGYDEAAADHYQRALSQHSPGAALRLAKLYLERNSPNIARRVYLYAYRSRIDLPDAALALGWLSERDGEFRAAEQWYRRALDADIAVVAESLHRSALLCGELDDLDVAARWARLAGRVEDLAATDVRPKDSIQLADGPLTLTLGPQPGADLTRFRE